MKNKHTHTQKHSPPLKKRRQPRKNYSSRKAATRPFELTTQTAKKDTPPEPRPSPFPIHTHNHARTHPHANKNNANRLKHNKHNKHNRPRKNKTTNRGQRSGPLPPYPRKKTRSKNNAIREKYRTDQKTATRPQENDADGKTIPRNCKRNAPRARATSAMKNITRASTLRKCEASSEKKNKGVPACPPPPRLEPCTEQPAPPKVATRRTFPQRRLWNKTTPHKKTARHSNYPTHVAVRTAWFHNLHRARTNKHRPQATKTGNPMKSATPQRIYGPTMRNKHHDPHYQNTACARISHTR